MSTLLTSTVFYLVNCTRDELARREELGEIDQDLFLCLAGLFATRARRSDYMFDADLHRRWDAEGAYKAALMGGDRTLATGYIDEFLIASNTVELIQQDARKRLNDPGAHLRQISRYLEKYQ